MSNANDEGTLNTLLTDMKESMDNEEFDQFSTNLVHDGKVNRRRVLVENLINTYKSERKESDDMTNIIVKAIEEEPPDEIHTILSKAVEENKLNNLITNLSKSQKKGQLDDTVSVMIKKEKKEPTKQLISAVNAIAHEYGKDNSFVEDILSKVKESGQINELLSIFNNAKERDRLYPLVSTLANAKNDKDLNRLLSFIFMKEEIKEEEKQKILKAGFNDDFLDKWLTIEKTIDEGNLLSEKLSQIIISGKSAELIAIQEENIEDVDDLFILLDEILFDEESEIDTTPAIHAKQKILRHKTKPKVKRKYSKEYIKKRKAVVELVELVEAADTDADADTDTDTDNVSRKSKIINRDKFKRQLLYKRQFSLGYTLPDVDYDLVQRHKFDTVDVNEPEKKPDEEEVYVPKTEVKKSKQYSESFLQKIFGSRKTVPSSATDDSSTSSRGRGYIRQKHSHLHLRKKRVPVQDSRLIIGEESKTPKKKKHIVTYINKKSFTIDDEYSDSDVSSFEELLGKKIKKMCDVSDEERSESGYLVGFRYEDEDDFDSKKKPKKSSLLLDMDTDEWISGARRRALVYFKIRKLDELFHFLGSHLVSDQPGNPIDYLIMLLEKCIRFRNGFGKAPVLFEEYHVESVYSSMDIFNEGFISLEQYKTGMDTLFIKEFVDVPLTNEKDMVLKETFIGDAIKMQRIYLKTILRGASVIFSPNTSFNNTLGSIWTKIDLYENA